MGKRIICLILFFPLAFGSTQGPNLGSSANGTVDGNISWTNPANVLNNNGISATCGPVASLSTCSEIQVTGFGFTIPATATINGIQVDWKKSSNENDAAGAITDLNGSRMIKGGVVVNNPIADPSNWPTTLTLVSYGGPANLWGTTWTPADINAANFGNELNCWNGVNSTGTPTASIDFVQITVTYTPASSGSLLKWFSYNQQPKRQTQTRTVQAMLHESGYSQ